MTPLIQSVRFLPLFVVQVLGALNDNIFKNALLILMTFSLLKGVDEGSLSLMTTLGAFLFIVPFFLFSAMAGQVADKYPKSLLIQYVKGAEVAIMTIGCVALYIGNVPFLLAMLFLMGTQSTFFGPLKYSILPEYLEKNELVEANSWIEASTFLAILVGTILGSSLILQDYGLEVVSILLILVAGAGWWVSYCLPESKAASPGVKVSWNIIRETWEISHYAYKHRRIFLSIAGISWFWVIGAVLLSQLPVYVTSYIGGAESVVTILLTVFSIGIGLGSFLCTKILKGEVQVTYVPLAVIGMSIALFDFTLASVFLPDVDATAPVMDAASFLAVPAHWRIMLDLLVLSACGGLYVVPLYTFIQSRGHAKHRARLMAANNVLNAAFMVAGGVVTMLLLSLSLPIWVVFLVLAICNTFALFYICRLLPDILMKSILRVILGAIYHVDVRGLKHYQKVKGNRLIIANHQSFLDPILLIAYLPDQLTFAVNTHIARHWLVRPFLHLVDTFSIDPTNPMAAKALADRVKRGESVVIFPEGRITVTGTLMKIYAGPGMIADKADATIVPVSIQGAQYTPFSRLRKLFPTHLFPPISIQVMESQKLDIPSDIKGATRRDYASQRLYHIMTEMMVFSNPTDMTVYDALLDVAQTYGRRHVIAMDSKRVPLSYGQLITRSMVLGRALQSYTFKGDAVGVFLPNSLACLVSFFGLQATGRVPAMLNFSSGPQNVISACETAKIDCVITSEQFVEQGKLEPYIEALKERNITVIYLERMRNRIRLPQKLASLILSRLPSLYYKRYFQKSPDSPAVILFTSGSEGTPKGVVLSHQNLHANRFQIASAVDFNPADHVFNAMPMFHSFGLTAGTLLPVLSGVRTFFYPSPLHYRIIPELIYDLNATIMFGTDTFLSGYAHHAHPYDFYSIRYIFAGAEKLQEKTRVLWSHKFGVRIFEGYGATETSPVVSMNTPMHNKPGSVGRFLPCIDYKLESVPGVEEGGRLYVSGPNIMLGYMRAENPGEIQPPEDGVYDTGDIVKVDEEGYITICGRAKRFAKVAGEMVSLTAVEEAMYGLWNDDAHAVVSIPDAKKGEQLVLVTTHVGAERPEIAAYMKQQGVSELWVPKTIKVVDAVPLLGTGKTDYPSVQELVA